MTWWLEMRRAVGRWAGLACLALASAASATEPMAPPVSVEAPASGPAQGGGATLPQGRDARDAPAPSGTPTPGASHGIESADVYVPPAPDRLVPGGRMGGSTRGPVVCPSEVLALVPEDHVGLTADAQPTLYWFLGEATSCRVDFILNDPRETKPRIEQQIPGPHAAGIHALALSDLGVSLEPGLVYTWFIQIVPDPEARSKDVLSGGQVERVAGTPDTSVGGSPVARARVLGHEGLWYDALAALQRGIVAAPASDAERTAQSRLLATQGLAAATLPEAGDVDVAAPPPSLHP